MSEAGNGTLADDPATTQRWTLTLECKGGFRYRYEVGFTVSGREVVMNSHAALRELTVNRFQRASRELAGKL